MPATSSRTFQILAIDDRDGEDCRRVIQWLTTGERAHYHIDQTESRAEALEALARGDHDVALIFAESADDSALELIREARGAHQRTSFILIAPGIDASFEDYALDSGAVDCLDSQQIDRVGVERAVARATRQASVYSELRETRRHLSEAQHSAAAAGERSRSAQLLHSILRNLPIIVGQLDHRAAVIDAQGAGLLPQGIRPERLIGRVFTDLFPQSRGPVAEALAGGTASFNLSGFARGQEWHAEFFVAADRDQPGGATFLGRDISERRWLEVNLLGTSDAEQQRLGTDIHDGLGQQLTGLAFMAAALRDRLKLSLPDEVPQADALARLARDATQQSRAISRGLHPVQLEKLGLLAALEELAVQTRILHGIACNFRSRGPLPAREHAAELHVYRIAQEAIRNAVRHGGASHILVTLATHGRTHRLAVTDNGSGFDVAKVRASPTGRGLRLMGYRANMIGGSFNVTSRPGSGARITCAFSSPA